LEERRKIDFNIFWNDQRRDFGSDFSEIFWEMLLH
jgi:hypothetical protein